MNALRRILKQLPSRDIQLVASALAFSTIMSMIPFLAVSLAVLGSIDAFDSLYPKVESLLLNYLQGPAGTEGIAMIKKVLLRIHEGKIGKYGAITLVVTSILLLQNMEFGINRIWGLTTKRKAWKRILSYWAIFLSLPIILAIYTGISSHKALTALALGAGNKAINLFLIFGCLFLSYKLVPDTKVDNKPAAIGAFFATLGLSVLFAVFGWLTRAVFNYSKMYGSIAAIPAVLVWVLLIWYIILGGVAISASFQDQKSQT